MSTRDGARLLTTGQVAAIWGVDPKTASKWGKAGRLLTTQTLGGHYRFYAVEVNALFRGEMPERARELALAERERLSQGQPG